MKAVMAPTRSFAHLPGVMLQRKCACGGLPGPSGECEECRNKRLQRKVAQPSSLKPQHSEVPPIVREVLRSPGQPLDAATRALFEPHFGHDFRHVRVHTDSKATESARAVNALAFTVGSHIVFRRGSYTPLTVSGRTLLAHELAHTIQQNSTEHSTNATDPAEREATTVADNIAQGRTVSVQVKTRQFLARQAVTTAPAGDVYYYTRYQFPQPFLGLFDGEVSQSPRLVKLIMGVDFTPAGWGNLNPDSVIRQFESDMKRVVENTWSYRYELQSACEADKYRAKVELRINPQNPHASIFVYPDLGLRSRAGDGTAALQQSDTSVTETNPYKIEQEKQKKHKPNIERLIRPLKGHTFRQVPAAHEFGHLMGLDHILCKTNDTQCYGVTRKEASDIMGRGSFVSQRDYAPFVTIMERFGKDSLPAVCNKWRLVK